MDEPEPAVIRAAIAGDVDAFERLVRQFQPSVWRFLRHLLDDAALVEDVTQETLPATRLCRHRHRHRRQRRVRRCGPR